MPTGDVSVRSPSISILRTSPPLEVKTSPKPTLSFKQVVKLASKKAKETDGQVQQQDLSAKMDHMIKSQEEVKQLQEEMKQLQKAFDAKQE
ncbi:unnamed protein product [Mortierella alpina]